MRKRALVTGAGGFMGGHLVNRLKSEGFWVRGVDLKYLEFRAIETDEFILGDLRDPLLCESVLDQPFDEIYQFAVDVNERNTALNDVPRSATSIDLNILEACRKAGGRKIFHGFSGCSNSDSHFKNSKFTICSEGAAYPEALDGDSNLDSFFKEQLYLTYNQKYNIPVRLARFQNVFGPQGAWTGGEEQVLAAICRRMAEASNGETVEIIGDGDQEFSFIYVEECLNGIRRLMDNEFMGPVNLGSKETIAMNDLARMIMKIAGKKIKIRNVSCSSNVHSRSRKVGRIQEKQVKSSDISFLKGLEKTYIWIEEQVVAIEMLAVSGI